MTFGEVMIICFQSAPIQFDLVVFQKRENDLSNQITSLSSAAPLDQEECTTPPIGSRTK